MTSIDDAEAPAVPVKPLVIPAITSATSVSNRAVGVILEKMKLENTAIVGVKFFNGEGDLMIHDNLPRLLGLHNLSAREASEHLNISQVALSAISTGKRKPSLDTLMTLSGFFELPADRLMTASFDELLPDLCDRERYLRVEEKIRPGYAALARGEVVDIGTSKTAKTKTAKSKKDRR